MHDDIARFLYVGVVLELNFEVFVGSYAGFCLSFVQPFTQEACVTPAVCDDSAPFCDIWFKAFTGLSYIGPVITALNTKDDPSIGSSPSLKKPSLNN